jgi:hypothetical protein
MAQAPDNQDLLEIALGESSVDVLQPSDASAVRMIRSLVETIHLDHADPVPGDVLVRARKLATQLVDTPSWFDRALAIVMAPLFDDRPQLAMGLRGGELRQCTFGIDGHRLDLEIEPLEDDDPNTTQPTRIQGQIDGEDPIDEAIDVVVLFAGTDHVVATASSRTDGRFNLVLDAGEYEFAFRLAGQTLTIGSIEIP